MRIGTRGSALALAQARMVASAIEGAEIVVLSTSGDRDESGRHPRGAPHARSGSSERGSAPHEHRGAPHEHGGDKARWVDAIERALLDGRIDLAVHSAKDVPAELAGGLELIGCPARADARDALCVAPGRTPADPLVLADLPRGARVGTGSLRRIAQLRALREDIEPVELRGNVDTRLRRLAEGDFDAIVLARAGLERLRDAPEGKTAEASMASSNTRPPSRSIARTAVLDLGSPLDELVPAAGQGTLALQARAGDDAVAGAVAALRDVDTERSLAAERSLVRALGADCTSAMGAHARIDGATIELRAWIGLADGSAWIADTLAGVDPEALGRAVAERMLAVGAADMLAAGTAWSLTDSPRTANGAEGHR
jgi:hydroxymethylbilane synthase